MDDKKSYYECKRCFFKCYQKNTMKKHLERVKICERTLDSFQYEDEDLYELSLTRIYTEQKKTFCDICNKNFINVFSLKRHNHSCHKSVNNDKSKVSNSEINNNYVEDDEVNSNIDIEYSNIKNNDSNKNPLCYINNNNINNSVINNNVNIVNNNLSINIINFDDDWNTSHIDDKQKILLLLKKYKFTTTLENILENEVNLNVLIDNTTENGLVCNNNKFEKMDVKDIVKKTMKKLVYSLNNFKNEIYERNNHELDLDVINTEIKKANLKYKEYKSNKIDQTDVNNLIKNIYNKKKDDTYNHCKLLGY